jgi:hypothetical protein
MKLKSLLSDPLGASDDEVLGAESMYLECQADLRELAAFAAHQTGGDRIAALGEVLPRFAETADRVAEVDHGITAVEECVARILL